MPVLSESSTRQWKYQPIIMITVRSGIGTGSAVTPVSDAVPVVINLCGIMKS